MTIAQSYVGRFAPSPTGPLHLGSLLTALASYLDARSNKGQWLLRMEDLDPAREPAGAAEQILYQLQDYGLYWDGDVLYQSMRLPAYASVLEALQARNLLFQCNCSRQKISAMGSVYNGNCRTRSEPITSSFALRLKTEDINIEFVDTIQGPQVHNLLKQTGDYVIRRRDRLFAYQLAVVVDDAYQGITDIVRGNDLLDSTPRQIYLQGLLGYTTPRYAHLPIVVNAEGQKLSKQHLAEPLKSSVKNSVLHQALGGLGLNPPADHRKLPVSAQLDWAIDHWRIQAVPKLATISEHIFDKG
jgi:glutamyl-Q tRNA(Asp) synthetase